MFVIVADQSSETNLVTQKKKGKKRGKQMVKGKGKFLQTGQTSPLL